MAREGQYGNWMPLPQLPDPKPALQQVKGIYMFAEPAPPLPPKSGSASSFDDEDEEDRNDYEDGIDYDNDYDDAGFVTSVAPETESMPSGVKEIQDMEEQKDAGTTNITTPFINKSAERKDSRRLLIVILYVLVTMSFAMWTGLLSLILVKYSALSEELKALNLSHLEMLRTVKEDLGFIQTTQHILERSIKQNFNELQDITASTCSSKNITFFHSCPTSWKSQGGNCYYFSTERKDRNNAWLDCISERAHLVSICSDDEQGFLKNSISDTYWLGMTDSEVEGKWMWQDMDLHVSTSYWDFTKGEPKEGKEKNCGIMNPGGTWASAQCTLQYRWICKKKLICPDASVQSKPFHQCTE
ncbi:C-type lectin domain family 17, member A-like [Hemicordylus capensis]|uniref:C-type lectin domain family 17, member A-like n=1 Tax=Hemicordylus capensis TaxID=884348 RepID=UPI002303E69E|nr:C-type lectin domain family 17, member A-like [Hemicordylus capensis]